MSKYKIIMTDIDDTLLNSQHQISMENKKAIKQLQQKGIPVVLASGRPDGGMVKLIKELELDQSEGYIAAFNGGKIMRTDTQETMFETGIELEHFTQIVHYAQANNISVCSYDNDTIVLNKLSAEAQIEIELTGMKYQVVDDLPAYFTNKTIPKALLFAPEEMIKKMKSELQELYDDQLELMISKPIFLEVTPKGVHKGYAVKQLATIFGIDIAEIIAVGDGGNDIEMLVEAGLGLAVLNAADKVKMIADEVIVSNDEHALAYISQLYFS